MGENGRKETAVSEVIGEIMIIALVVALTAVIGALVFGMAGNVQQTKVVGVTATRADEGFVRVTYAGGEKQDLLFWLNISVNGTPPVRMGDFGGTIPLDVGNTTMIRAPVPGNDHVIVTAAFSDSSEQVVLDTIV